VRKATAPAATRPPAPRRRAEAKIALSDNARVVLERRYLVKGADGAPAETPEQLFRRVARDVALAEAGYADHRAPAAAAAAEAAF
jgi:ribonucleoside-diphosphate reductase alpha chain